MAAKLSFNDAIFVGLAKEVEIPSLVELSKK